MGELAGSCHALISTFNSHIDGVIKLITELSTGDRASAVSSRSSLIQSLTALAELFDLMSRISPEPIATDYRRQCIAALMRAIEVVHSLGHGDFTVIGAFFVVRNRANNYP